MRPHSTRRGYLAAIGGAVALSGVSKQVQAASEAVCSRAEQFRTELEQAKSRLATLEREQAESKEQLDDLRLEIMHLHAESHDSHYDEETKARANEVGDRLRESTMLIELMYEHGSATATGWFVDEHHILTNAHNVDGEFTDTIGLTAGGDTFEFEVLGYDENRSPDVALLRTDYAGTPLPTGSSDALQYDDPLVMVGHPGGFGYWVTTLGPFENKGRDFRGAEKLHTGIPGISGNSGSPVATLDGNVVGMLNASSSGGMTDSMGNPSPASTRVHHRLLAPETTTELVPVEVALDTMGRWR